MDTMYLLLILGIAFYLYLRLSARIEKCEQLIKQLRPEPSPVINQQPPPPPDFPETVEEKPKDFVLDFLESIPKESTSRESKLQESAKTAQISTQPPKRDTPSFSLQIPSFIKENWMGVFGSIAVVIGAVCFGLNSEIMQRPEARVTLMIAFSLLFFGISFKLKERPEWALLCGWLKSIAGTVILFSTMGAGGIEGLKFIHTPLYALGFLCVGIVTNVALASITPNQGVASLHVILSVVAFCFAPQAFILLPLGAIVAVIGLANAYRAKWDLHLLLIVIAFACQNCYWTSQLETQLLPWMHGFAIAASLAVGLAAGLIHYTKKYQSPEFEPIPFFAHIINWGLLTWNLWLHSFFSWTPLVLSCLAIAGFLLAKIAKRKQIRWLYLTDTLIAQGVALAAIITLSTYSMNRLDIGLLAVVETILFCLIAQFEKEKFLLQIGYLLQLIATIMLLCACNHMKSFHELQLAADVYLRMGIAMALSWGFFFYNRWKKLPIDDLRFIFDHEQNPKHPLSLGSILGTFFLLSIYFHGLHTVTLQLFTFAVIVAMSYWRKLNEDASSNVSLAMVLIAVYATNLIQLLSLSFAQTTPSILSHANFLGIVLLNLFLIAGRLLDFKMWHKNFYALAIYALGIQVGLLTYVYTKEISLLIPGMAYLAYSLFALEAGQRLPKFLRELKIEEKVIQIGLAFLVAFISRFLTVHLQVSPIWHGISLQWATEALALCALLYWLAFSPKNSAYSELTRSFLDLLVEASLGFLTFCIVLEMPEAARPLIWAILAIGLLLGSLSYNWPSRLYAYSWLYFIASIAHMAFVTSTLTMPSLFLLERYHFLTFFAIALQIVYAYLVYGKLSEVRFPLINRFYSLSVLLPVFVGIGLLFAFNFEKTLLTLLWVGLIGAYLAAGLLIKSKISIQIGMIALLLCSARLIIFDLVQSDLSVRALVFVGVGGLMLGISALYKKYKYRIMVHE